MLNQTTLLEQHLLFSSDNQHEILNQVSQYLYPHQMKTTFKERLQSRLFGVFFGHSALFDLHYGANVEIDTGDESNYYLIRSTLAGKAVISNGCEETHIKRGSLTITSAGERNYISSNADCRSLLLRVGRKDLEFQLNQLLDRTIKETLVFDINIDPNSEAAKKVLYTLSYICQMCQNKHSPMPGELCESLSEYLVSVLLTQLPHNYSEEIQQRNHCITPHYVKKAREYIEQNLHQTIALPTLAKQTGVSVRTLQSAFSHFVQQSPTEYIRSRRLTRVRDDLLNAAPNESVTNIMLKNGINSFGHFSKAYKKRFGCSPSDTLNTRQ